MGIPVPTPPEGMSPYMPDKLHPSHVVWDITRGDLDPVWYCGTCGQYAYKRCKNMLAPCRGPLEVGTPPWYRLNFLREGRYPPNKKTGQLWAKPTLALRSISYAEQTSTAKVPIISEPP